MNFVQSFVIALYMIGNFPLQRSGNINPFTERVCLFMIFRQAGHLTVPASWTNKVDGTIDFIQLKNDWNLTGPIGINWLRVTGDLYVAQKALDNGFMNNCPVYVEDGVYGVNRHSIASLNIILTMASSQMVIYMSNIHVYEAVKTKQLASEKWENSFYMTSMNGLMGAVSSLTHRFTIFTIFVLNNWKSFAVFWIRKIAHLCGFRPFQGDMYTMIMVDTDIPASPSVNETHPLLHWLVTNIKDGNMSTGQEFVRYEGPQPPDRKSHYYYFLLYKQAASIPVNSFYPYTEHCPRYFGRCKFNINGLVADKHLKLVGVSWMRATTVIYIPFRNIYLNCAGSSQHWCTGKQGYKGDASCQTGLSTVVHPSVFVG